MAVDIHPALAVPPVERGEAPVALGILPVGAVWMLVREGRVILIGLCQRARTGGLEVQEVELPLQRLVADEAIAIGLGTRLEEEQLFLGLCLGHGGHDLLVGVLGTTGGIQHLLRGTGTVDGDRVEDHVADRVHVLADQSDELLRQVGTVDR